MLTLVLLIVGVSIVGGIGGFSHIKAPSIFRPEEVELHKFSAVLAATQPFNKRCTEQIKSAINPIKRLTFWLRGSETFRILAVDCLVQHLGSFMQENRSQSRLDNFVISSGP